MYKGLWYNEPVINKDNNMKLGEIAQVKRESLENNIIGLFEWLKEEGLDVELVNLIATLDYGTGVIKVYTEDNVVFIENSNDGCANCGESVEMNAPFDYAEVKNVIQTMMGESLKDTTEPSKDDIE